jgi:hypothetical protein
VTGMVIEKFHNSQYANAATVFPKWK